MRDIDEFSKNFYLIFYIADLISCIHGIHRQKKKK